MKKSTLLLAVFSLFAASLVAQPTLQMNVLPSIGDVHWLQEVDTNTITQGNAGPNQTWNFSGIQPVPGMPPTQYQYLAPSNTPPQYASIFPAANIATKINSDTVVYGYAKKEANQYSFLGIKNAYIAQVYFNTDIQLKNLSYNGSFQDDYTNTSDAGTGIIFYGKGNRTVTYDSYGTMQTPNGTFPNTMRIKSVSVQIDSAEFSGLKIISETTLTTYDWLVGNQPSALVSVYYSHTVSTTYFPGFPPQVSDLGTTKSAYYVSSATTGTFDRPNGLTGVTLGFAGPNPATDQLSLKITAENDRPDMQIMLTDINGRVIETQALALYPGENILNLPVGDLSAGAYFLTLTDGNGLKTIQWQKQ